MALTFSFVSSSDDAFSRMWEHRLGALNPECSLEHLQVLMTCEPHKEHYFVVGANQQGEVVAIAYLAIQTVNALGLHWRVLTLGGSIGADALWIDGARETYAGVVRELLQFTKKHIKHSLIVLKPFDASRDTDRLKTNADELRFINIYGTTQADVDLSTLETYEAYLATLDKKKRYWLRKVDKDAELAGVTMERTADFGHLVPALYPLFQSVSERAKEVKDLDPLGIKYLECMADLKTLRTQAVLVRAGERIVGFLVLVEQGPVLCCGLCGMDHSVSKTYNTWYLLMLQAIKYGIESKKRAVILGTTNFNMKRKLGARKYDLWISLRFTSSFLTMALAPVLRMWLRKNLFTHGEAPEQVAGADAAV